LVKVSSPPASCFQFVLIFIHLRNRLAAHSLSGCETGCGYRLPTENAATIRHKNK